MKTKLFILIILSIVANVALAQNIQVRAYAPNSDYKQIVIGKNALDDLWNECSLEYCKATIIYYFEEMDNPQSQEHVFIQDVNRDDTAIVINYKYETDNLKDGKSVKVKFTYFFTAGRTLFPIIEDGPAPGEKDYRTVAILEFSKK